MDDLTQIERGYESVAEYNRAMEQEKILSYEREAADALKAAVNKAIVLFLCEQGYHQKNGFDLTGSCGQCPYRTDAIYLGLNDDIGTFFCLNTECPYPENVAEFEPISPFDDDDLPF